MMLSSFHNRMSAIRTKYTTAQITVDTIPQPPPPPVKHGKLTSPVCTVCCPMKRILNTPGTCRTGQHNHHVVVHAAFVVYSTCWQMQTQKDAEECSCWRSGSDARAAAAGIRVDHAARYIPAA